MELRVHYKIKGSLKRFVHIIYSIIKFRKVSICVIRRSIVAIE